MGGHGAEAIGNINPVGMGDRGTGFAMLTPPKDERSGQSVRFFLWLYSLLLRGGLLRSSLGRQACPALTAIPAVRAWHLAAAMETVTREDEQHVGARAHKALALQPALAALPLLMAVVGRARVLPGMPEPAPRRTLVLLPAAS